jgi:hypothetical protein
VGDVVGWSMSAVGALLVLVGLRDIFHTIWHPSGSGGLSRRLMRTVWRTGRRARRLRPLSGALAMIVVVVSWFVLIVLGWALVYLPHLPEAFIYGSGLDAATRGGLLDATYLSVVTLATLGFGDIVPAAGWLRIAVPIQALVGFALITAAVSWVLQVYPALTRRRTLAGRLSLLHRVPPEPLLSGGEFRLAAAVLESLAMDLVQARVDLTQYAETYFFRDDDADASLPAMFGIALELEEMARRSSDAEVRFAGQLLATSAGDYARVVDEQFLRVGGSVGEIAAAYARDHGHDLVATPAGRDGQPD